MAHDQQVPQRIVRRSGAIRQRFLPLILCGCYLLALWAPWAGQQLSDWSLPESWPDVLRPRLPQLLVALLLFLAAMGAEVSRLRMVTRRPALLFSSLAAVWIAPALVVVSARWILPIFVDPVAATSLLVGFALVAAMPVANSSAAWTQQSRGELSWALSLVVLSIVVCPWVIPLVLRVLGFTFTAVQSEGLMQLMTTFTGAKFVVWVLLPTALGMIVRRWVGPMRVAKHRETVLLTSTVALLLLNYINASVSLPEIKADLEWSWIVAIFVFAFLICLSGLVAARLIGRLLLAPPEAVTAIDYALSMKNTGLALALASDVLADQPILLLPMFAVTLVQHLFAGALHRHAVQQGIASLPP